MKNIGKQKNRAAVEDEGWMQHGGDHVTIIACRMEWEWPGAMAESNTVANVEAGHLSMCTAGVWSYSHKTHTHREGESGWREREIQRGVRNDVCGARTAHKAMKLMEMALGYECLNAGIFYIENDLCIRWCYFNLHCHFIMDMIHIEMTKVGL